MLTQRAASPGTHARTDIRTYKGIGVSPGIAIGRAVLIEKREAAAYRVPIREEDVPAEVTRFNEAVEHTRDALLELKHKVSRSMGDEYAQIFEAHAMMVSDASFSDKVIQKIEEEQVNAEWAVAEVSEELQARFASFDDEYLRERVADVKDVAERVLTKLQGGAHHDLSEITHDVIILADDLTPSDTIHFNRRPIVGFATEAGGRTSHTSIIAKSLFMPAVIGVPRLTKTIDNNELVIIDGYEGTVIANPTQAMIAEYQARVMRHEEAERRLLENREAPAVTKDGIRVSLQANIELVQELKDAIRFGAEGIGLYRSEFLYISKSPLLPNEEEHFQLYKSLAEAMAPQWCVIRTFDLGGRKLAR
jgi:phosphotransferase system enzyme I (PtsI)